MKRMTLGGIVAAVVLAAAPAASAMTSELAPPANEKPIFVVRTGDVSAADALEDYVHDHPEARGTVRKMSEGMRDQLRSGQDADVGTPEASIADQMSELNDLDEALDTNSAASVTPSNPNTFPVRGAKTGDRWAWHQMRTIVEGAYCSSGGCTVTDKFSVRAAVDPGTKTSKLTLTTSYFPNSGAFSQRRLRTFAVCSGKVCGTQLYTGWKTGSSVKYLSSTSDRSGKPLTIATGLEVYSPRGWTYDGAKTRDCKGQPRTDNRCRYS